MKDVIKSTLGLLIVIGCIIAINFIFLAKHAKEADIRNNELDIKIIELEDRIDSLEIRIIRLESMMDSDLLDSKESDNMPREASDFNAEPLLG